MTYCSIKSRRIIPFFIRISNLRIHRLLQRHMCIAKFADSTWTKNTNIRANRLKFAIWIPCQEVHHIRKAPHFWTVGCPTVYENYEICDTAFIWSKHNPADCLTNMGKRQIYDMCNLRRDTRRPYQTVGHTQHRQRRRRRNWGNKGHR